MLLIFIDQLLGTSAYFSFLWGYEHPQTHPRLYNPTFMDTSAPVSQDSKEPWYSRR